MATRDHGGEATDARWSAAEDPETIRVLCVDDDRSVLDLTAEYLERVDGAIEVETATSAEEGRELLEDRGYDCVVSDYDMPGATGLEFLERIQPEWPELPFILYTGKGSEEIASDAISTGVTDYLQKDGGRDHYERLANRIRTAVVSYRARRALERREERFRKLTENATDIVCVLAEDATIDYISPSVERILGYEPSDLVGENAFEYMHPDDREDVWEVFTEALEDPDGEPTAEYRFRHADGSWRWIEARGRNRLDDDAIGGFVANVRDVSEQREHERRLAEEREFVETLLETVPDVFYAFDPDGTFLHWNDELTEVTGYADGEIAEMHPVDFVPESERETIADAIETIIEEERPLTVESAFETEDGDRLPFEFTGNVIRDADGELRGIAGIGRDLSERREHERELAEERALVENLFDAVPDTFFAFDTSGSFFRWNSRVPEVTGYTDEEIAEMDPTAFFEGEDVDRVADAIGTIVSEREPVTLEADLVTRDGEAIPYEFIGAPLTDEAGDLRGVVGIGRDVTERKRREEHLEMLEAFVETVDDGIYALDPEGRYVYVNPVVEERTAYSREELLGASPRKISPDIDAEQFERAIVEMLEGDREVFTTELDIHPREGDPFPAEVKVSPLFVDGEFRGSVGVTRDVTERKARERELRRQNERLEEFSSVVAHDLRTPLTTAKGRVDLAAEDCDSEHLEPARLSLDRMETLIDDLLVLARQGEAIGGTEPVSLRSVVERGWSTVDADGADLVVDLPADLGVVADGSRLRQALENLLDNAVEHGAAGGDDVTVTVGPLPDGEGFYVADDGRGIPDAEAQDVLEAGYSTADDGTGFGLAIVREVVSAHGWGLSVAESEDGGARFEITGVDVHPE